MLLERTQHPVAVFRIRPYTEFDGTASNNLLTGISRISCRDFVNIDEEAVFEPGDGRGERAGVKNFGKFFLGLPQRLLGLEVTGDIGGGGYQASPAVDVDKLGGEEHPVDLATLHPELVLFITDTPLFLQLFHHAVAFPGVDPHVELRGTPADDLLAGVSGQPGKAIVDLDENAVLEGIDGNGVRAGAEGLGELLLRFFQCLLRPLALGDIHGVYQQVLQLTVVRHRRPVDVNPVALPVLLPGNHLPASLALRHRFLEAGAQFFQLFLRPPRVGGLHAGDFFRGPAVYRHEGRVGVPDGSIRVDHQDGVGGFFQQAGVELLALLERFFHPLALGDVRGHRQHADIAADVDFLGGAEPGAHFPGLYPEAELLVTHLPFFIEEPGHLLLVRGVEPQVELVVGVADELFTTVPGDMGEGLVDLDVIAVFQADDDHHVRAGAEGLVELLLGLLQGVLGAAALYLR